MTSLVRWEMTNVVGQKMTGLVRWEMTNVVRHKMTGLVRWEMTNVVGQKMTSVVRQTDLLVEVYVLEYFEGLVVVSEQTVES